MFFVVVVELKCGPWEQKLRSTLATWHHTWWLLEFKRIFSNVVLKLHVGPLLGCVTSEDGLVSLRESDRESDGIGSGPQAAASLVHEGSWTRCVLTAEKKKRVCFIHDSRWKFQIKYLEEMRDVQLAAKHRPPCSWVSFVLSPARLCGASPCRPSQGLRLWLMRLSAYVGQLRLG